jgi:hypothetical protein
LKKKNYKELRESIIANNMKRNGPGPISGNTWQLHGRAVGVTRKPVRKVVLLAEI